jgi:hypothetical protein
MKEHEGPRTLCLRSTCAVNNRRQPCFTAQIQLQELMNNALATKSHQHALVPF